MVYHVSKRILKKTYNLPLKFEHFHFSVSSSNFMTASWLPIFASAKPSQTILSIDRSEPRFKSHTGGKIRKTYKCLLDFHQLFLIITEVWPYNFHVSQ